MIVGEKVGDPLILFVTPNLLRSLEDDHDSLLVKLPNGEREIDAQRAPKKNYKTQFVRDLFIRAFRRFFFAKSSLTTHY